ncbi:hypothetical protein SCHPADRAFT_928929 [Schizopora paradoxa]|uniref:Uncharacterized protein n=1 Tax=Schizopora paradoxa TaxID=27342 RepID=A0A0H2S7P5_9AGAM|nr:hypothetical protein SCHPADRAFT_928929 [Schizopora paradoxa]
MPRPAQSTSNATSMNLIALEEETTLRALLLQIKRTLKDKGLKSVELRRQIFNYLTEQQEFDDAWYFPVQRVLDFSDITYCWDNAFFLSSANSKDNSKNKPFIMRFVGILASLKIEATKVSVGIEPFGQWKTGFTSLRNQLGMSFTDEWSDKVMVERTKEGNDDLKALFKIISDKTGDFETLDPSKINPGDVVLIEARIRREPKENTQSSASDTTGTSVPNQTPPVPPTGTSVPLSSHPGGPTLPVQPGRDAIVEDEARGRNSNDVPNNSVQEALVDNSKNRRVRSFLVRFGGRQTNRGSIVAEAGQNAGNVFIAPRLGEIADRVGRNLEEAVVPKRDLKRTPEIVVTLDLVTVILLGSAST